MISGHDLFFLLSGLFGGLALFIWGMSLMSDALRRFAGNRLQIVVSGVTKNRLVSMTIGTVLGIFIQSSATTVMLVGFINAGLMTLAQSVPLMLGANIGTTLAMQLISLKISEYCFVAIVIGILMQMLAPGDRLKQVGTAIVGFGILLLGMDIMSNTIAPHRELFKPILAAADGSTFKGLVLGTLLTTAITGIIQSSGATIAMGFALINAGVCTNLQQVYPIFLGANIGTCATALLGSIGTNIQARRSAVSHLMFNIIGAIVGIAAAPLFYRFIPMLSPGNAPENVIRQMANANTIKMVIMALIVLPFPALYARFIERIMPSRKPLPQPSYLNLELLAKPEMAIWAALRELQRVTQVCARSFRLAFELILKSDGKKLGQIKRNEQMVDEIKVAARDYLFHLAKRKLTRRQAIIIQHIERCMADIERVGDHIDSISDTTTRQHPTPYRFDHQVLELLTDLYDRAAQTLKLVIESLNDDNRDFKGMAEKILAARDEYAERSFQAKNDFLDRMAKHEIPPRTGMFFSEYVADIDRLVKHSKRIALAERAPYFWLKRYKFDRESPEEPDLQPPPASDPHDFLDKLQKEDTF
jgi:phosphate:Na+ symporter